ncbi:transglutaminase family protein [Azomonas macrocytogenes]|uniref:Transglutaminase-like putative cysteine protease n=1 Tax=Azomonas macrocytogenes TaxID=69962 RepID=A0A839T7J5_AZOMA|nr:transglutaminase family protein [Azomonas macrocytogenes]MBB3103643.1 transglutaminase-like putative cysteine protease [Azomonas macrocytogenes]
MKLSISHDTAYYYEDQVRASIQYLRLTPQESPRQRVLGWQLDLPRPAQVQVDPYGNILHVLTLDEPHDTIRIHASGQVDIDEACEAERYDGSPLPFLRSTHLTQADQALRQFALRNVGEQRDRAALGNLMLALREHMAYTPGSTHVESTAAEAFAGCAGVCQDHTHAFLACLRTLGIPARYVSGYLFTDDCGHVASHAWAEAWLNGAWYSFDITNRLNKPERHLKLAVGMDYLDACPVRGMRRGGGYEKMHAHVIVSPAEIQIVQQQQQ